MLKPRLGRIPEVTKQRVFELLVQDPKPCNFSFNAWVYSQVKRARFTLGKMGWRGADGVHWEYG